MKTGHHHSRITSSHDVVRTALSAASRSIWSAKTERPVMSSCKEIQSADLPSSSEKRSISSRAGKARRNTNWTRNRTKDTSLSSIVGIKEGVQRAGTMRRVGAHRRWDAAGLDTIRGLLWKRDPDADDVVDKVVVRERKRICRTYA